MARDFRAIASSSTRRQSDCATVVRAVFWASSSVAKLDELIYDMKKVSTALDQLLVCLDDQRIAVEGGLQRVGSVIVMHPLLSMA